jgi:MraZ protein
MALESLFSGAALRAVDAEGGLQLPDFVLRTLARRSDARRLLFAPHEVDPCMTGYDPGYEAWLFAEAERRRLREDALGVAAGAHHRRTRRTFGAAESAGVDEAGWILLPPMARRRAGIEGAALLIGTGGSFEIWNPEVARAADDEELRRLAAFALGEQYPRGESEVAE